MLKKLKSFFWEDDRAVFRGLILLALLNLSLIYYLGASAPGSPAFLPTMMSVSPMVSSSIKVIQSRIQKEIQPKRQPKRLSQPVIPKKVAQDEKNVDIVVPGPVPTPVPVDSVNEVKKRVPKKKPLPGGGVINRIIFASNRDGRFYQLYMIDSNGENLERLTFSNSFDRDPQASYDGKKLAFSSNRYGNYQIYIMDFITRSVVQITDGELDKTNPVWSPDNKKILYTVNNGRSSYIAMMEADGGNQELITQPGGNHYGYGFSPDCKKISYEAINQDNHEIFIMDLKTKKSVSIVDYDGLTDVGDPVFSPKQNILLFTSDSLQHNRRQIYIYDDDVKHYYRITHDDKDKDDPIFSPDGKMVAYIAKWQNAWNIYVMNADGSQQRNITQSHYDHVVPSWR